MGINFEESGTVAINESDDVSESCDASRKLDHVTSAFLTCRTQHNFLCKLANTNRNNNHVPETARQEMCLKTFANFSCIGKKPLRIHDEYA